MKPSVHRLQPPVNPLHSLSDAGRWRSAVSLSLLLNVGLVAFAGVAGYSPPGVPGEPGIPGIPGAPGASNAAVEWTIESGGGEAGARGGSAAGRAGTSSSAAGSASDNSNFSLVPRSPLDRAGLLNHYSRQGTTTGTKSTNHQATGPSAGVPSGGGTSGTTAHYRVSNREYFPDPIRALPTAPSRNGVKWRDLNQAPAPLPSLPTFLGGTVQRDSSPAPTTAQGSLSSFRPSPAPAHTAGPAHYSGSPASGQGTAVYSGGSASSASSSPIGSGAVGGNVNGRGHFEGTSRGAGGGNSNGMGSGNQAGNSSSGGSNGLIGNGGTSDGPGAGGNLASSPFAPRAVATPRSEEPTKPAYAAPPAPVERVNPAPSSAPPKNDPRPEPKPEPRAAIAPPPRQKVVREAAPERIFKPRLTRKMRRDKRVAAVRVEVDVDEKGRSTPRITESSGDRDLDEAALKAARKTRWKPRTEDGVATRSTQSIRYDINVDDKGDGESDDDDNE